LSYRVHQVTVRETLV